MGNTKKRDVLKNSRYLLIVGIIIVVISPLIFSLDWSTSLFRGSGEVGDLIGGITAPISSLIGSILVFFALKAQIDANRIIQDQIESQKSDEKVKRNIQQISDLYSYFIKSIDDFTYSKKVWITGESLFKSKTQDVNCYGLEAIEVFANEFGRNSNDPHSDECFDFLKVRDFYTILHSAEYLLDKIVALDLVDEDKSFYFDLIANQFKFRILPIFDDVTENITACETCGDLHGHIPIRLFSKIQDIRRKVNKNNSP